MSLASAPDPAAGRARTVFLPHDLAEVPAAPATAAEWATFRSATHMLNTIFPFDIRHPDWRRAHDAWHVGHLRYLRTAHGMEPFQARQLPFGDQSRRYAQPTDVLIFPTHSEFTSPIFQRHLAGRKPVKLSCVCLVQTHPESRGNVVAVLDLDNNAICGVFVPGQAFPPYDPNRPDRRIYNEQYGFYGERAVSKYLAYPILLPMSFGSRPVRLQGFRAANDPKIFSQSVARLSNLTNWPVTAKSSICRRITEAYGLSVANFPRP